MLNNKELKTVIEYVERAIYKKICGWEGIKDYFVYMYKSDLFNGKRVKDDELCIYIPKEYSLSKGKLSITKHGNKIYFGVERLLRESFDIKSLEDSFIMGLEDSLTFLKIPNNFTFSDRLDIGKKVFDLWYDTVGQKRIKNLIEGKNTSFIRGDFEIPCKGLDPKIIPIASLDLDDFKIRYPARNHSSRGFSGVIVRVSRVFIRNSSSIDFLEDIVLLDSMFKDSLCGNSSYFYLNKSDRDDLDYIIKKVLKEYGCNV